MESEDSILYEFLTYAEWPQEPEIVVCSFYRYSLAIVIAPFRMFNLMSRTAHNVLDAY